MRTDYVRDAMTELGYHRRELEYMLWDCLLARRVEAATEESEALDESVGRLIALLTRSA